MIPVPKPRLPRLRRAPTGPNKTSTPSGTRDTFSWGLSLFTFLVGVIKFFEAVYAARNVPELPAGDIPEKPPPQLSVIVLARNEEQTLEKALRSVLLQDYPALEVIPVNDRSMDGTGEIMEQMAADHVNARVVHVKSLPEGWIGKNHAAYVGARHARGDWLLFTDADIRFRRGALRQTVTYAESNQLDHLTLVPDMELKGYWLRGVVALFYVVFLLYRGSHRANLPRYKMGAGVGAFNLIRRSAYHKIGTYAALAQRPDDDLALGNRVKELGLSQRMLLGHRLLSVRWYESLGALIRGFEKNTFADLGYNAPRAMTYSALLVLVAAWPFVGIFSGGARSLLYLGAAASQVGTFLVANYHLGRKVFLLAPGYPVYVLIFAYAIIRSTLLTVVRGGIYWRDTFYPLSLLRGGETIRSNPWFRRLQFLSIRWDKS